jgi:hypothetical protein
MEFSFQCGSVWMWNLVSDIKRETRTEGRWEQGAEVSGGWRKLYNDELRNFTLCQVQLEGEVNENEMGKTYSTNWVEGEEECT